MWHYKLGHLGAKQLTRFCIAHKIKIDQAEVNKLVLANCDACMGGKAKHRAFRNKNPVPWRPPTRPLECIYWDVVGPMSTWTMDARDDTQEGPKSDRGAHRWKKWTRMRVDSLEGKRYFLNMLDVYTHFQWVFTVRYKSEVPHLLRVACEQIMNEIGLKIGRVHMDGGSEFLNHELVDYLSEKGIEINVTVPYSPTLNNYIERNNGTTVGKARCLMIQCGAPFELWPQAVELIPFIQNRAPQHVIGGKIPYQEMKAEEAKSNPGMSLDKLYVFGADVFYMPANDADKGKMDPRVRPAIYVGYSRRYNAMKILTLEDEKVRIQQSRDVTIPGQLTFNQMERLKAFLNEKKGESKIDDDDANAEEWEVERIDDEVYEDGVEKFLVYWKGFAEPTWEPRKNLTHCNASIKEFYNRKKGMLAENVPLRFELAQVVIPADQPKRSHEGQVKPPAPAYFEVPKLHPAEGEQDLYHQVICAMDRTVDKALEKAEEERISALLVDIPKNLLEAQRSKYARQWEEAVKKEMKSCVDAGVFEPCEELPRGAHVISTRLVFAVKPDSQNRVERFKARFVARGFSQVDGIDYHETYSPTVNRKSVRLLLTIAALKDLELSQMDFDTAYLNAELEENIYIETPWGITSKAKYQKLLKALYGLKQAAREWNKAADKMLRSLGYEPTTHDSCFYVKWVGAECILIMLYVDDLVAAYHILIEHVWLKDKEQISLTFKLKDLGECTWILKMRVRRDRKNRIIYVSQAGYVEKILHNHGMEMCKPVNTPFWIADITVPPVAKSPKVESNWRECTSEEIKEYQCMVGELLYAATVTRIDIAYIVGRLAMYTQKPWTYHVSAAKHVYRYLRGATQYELAFGDLTLDGPDKYMLEMYVDASWADAKDNRKSTTGYISMLNGSPISWKSVKQQNIALSSTEAELYALDAATREAKFLVMWMESYQKVLLRARVYEDNQGAICLADHQTDHEKTKHIDRTYFYVRDMLAQNVIEIRYLPTEEQLADILTKVTPFKTFMKHVSKIMFTTESPVA